MSPRHISMALADNAGQYLNIVSRILEQTACRADKNPTVEDARNTKIIAASLTNKSRSCY